MSINKIREAIALKLIKAVGNGKGNLEGSLKAQQEQAKEKFFEQMNPIKESAYSQVFNAILQTKDNLIDHENKEIAENWGKHFVEYHNAMIALLKQDFSKAVMVVHNEFDKEDIYNFFADERSLEVLIDITADSMVEAMQSIENKNNEKEQLKEKLLNQLKDVVETLKELTSEDEGDKQFNVEIDNAMFTILLSDKNDSEENKCECGKCSTMRELEDLISNFFD